ncbi:MAG: phosphatidylglycerophosphatase A [Pyrinomonadaceae bacterium]|nr:phosphatidylglycerophosphatase A [Pyrinomonadaceae bacterium]
MLETIKSNFLTGLLSKKIRRRPAVLPLPDSIPAHLAHFIGTFGFSGYLPVIPATFGSAAAIGAIAAGQILAGFFPLLRNGSVFPLMIAAAVVSGVWASKRIAEMTGSKDPSIVVIDEVAGQWITFVFVAGTIGWFELFAGFLLFRFFDVFKFFPANKLERLPHGFGIMLDDVVSGVYAAAVLSFLAYFFA